MVITCEDAIKEVFRVKPGVLTVEDVYGEVEKRYPRVWTKGTIQTNLYYYSVNSGKYPGQIRVDGFLLSLGDGRFRLNSPTTQPQPGLRAQEILPKPSVVAPERIDERRRKEEVADPLAPLRTSLQEIALRIQKCNELLNSDLESASRESIESARVRFSEKIPEQLKDNRTIIDTELTLRKSVKSELSKAGSERKAAAGMVTIEKLMTNSQDLPRLEADLARAQSKENEFRQRIGKIDETFKILLDPTIAEFVPDDIKAKLKQGLQEGPCLHTSKRAVAQNPRFVVYECENCHERIRQEL